MQIETQMVNLYESIDFNVKGENVKKTRIILTESKRNHKDYINSLKYRYNKKNPYLPHFLITKKSEVFKIIDTNHYSDFMEDEEIDKNSIIICLENLGWLKKNPLEETYINWIGDIYKQKVFEKKWRDYFFWDTYNDGQIECLVKLIKELCDEYNIPKETIGHNVKQDGIEYFRGVISRSNFDFYYRDVNPSFDFKLFKNLLEND